MRLLLLLAVFLWPCNTLSAQKHDYNWVFGYTSGPIDTFSLNGGAVIDFNVRPPRVYKENLRMNFGASGLACSDSSGRLLFYSNGLRIYNHRFRLMQFGDTLNPGPIWELNKNRDYPSSPFGWGCIPAPGLRDCYYFFHPALTPKQGNNFYCGPLYYTLIDMAANNGEGKVLKKNQLILNDSIGRLGLVKHANGRDWWLLVPHTGRPQYSRFLISAQGVGSPIVQIIGDTFNQEDGTSTCLFSPDGSRYIRPDVFRGLYIFDFNRCTGELSNYFLMPELEGWFRVGGVEFSLDSRFLYVNAASNMIVKLDLEAPSLGYYAIDTIQRFDYYSYPTTLFPVGFFYPKLGPDGKIYYSASSTTRFMHVMHRPNLPGQACDLENHGLVLPRYNAFTVCPAPNYRLGSWEGSPCDTLHGRPEGDGFQKTSYESCLERQARGLPAPIVVPEDRKVGDKRESLMWLIRGRLQEMEDAH